MNIYLSASQAEDSRDAKMWETGLPPLTFNISKCLPVTRGAVHDCGKTSEEVIQGAETEKTAEKFEYQAVIFMLILLYLWFTNIKLMATCSIY